VAGVAGGQAPSCGCLDFVGRAVHGVLMDGARWQSLSYRCLADLGKRRWGPSSEWEEQKESSGSCPVRP